MRETGPLPTEAEPPQRVGVLRASCSALSNFWPPCLRCSAQDKALPYSGPQSPHLLNGRKPLEIQGRGGALSVPPLSPPPFFRLPLGCDSSTHSGACATLWLLSPPLHPLRGEPPAALSHPTQPTILLAQPAFQTRAPECLWREGPNQIFLSLLKTRGPQAE